MNLDCSRTGTFAVHLWCYRVDPCEAHTTAGVKTEGLLRAPTQTSGCFIPRTLLLWKAEFKMREFMMYMCVNIYTNA